MLSTRLGPKRRQIAPAAPPASQAEVLFGLAVIAALVIRRCAPAEAPSELQGFGAQRPYPQGQVPVAQGEQCGGVRRCQWLRLGVNPPQRSRLLLCARRCEYVAELFWSAAEHFGSGLGQMDA